MGLYDHINQTLQRVGDGLYLERTKIGEKQAIRRKSDFIADVVWTDDQQQEFDAFWLEHYGQKIPNDWHRLYQKISGTFRVDYFPEFLYSTKLEPLINPRAYCNVFADKSLLYALYSDIPGVRCPTAFLVNSFGTWQDGNARIISEEKACELLSDIGECLFKATLASSGGKSISVADFCGGKDRRTGLTVRDFFRKYRQNFVVQEKIAPNAVLKQIYPDALSTFRVMTYLAGDHIGHCPPAMRMGVGGMEVDNITSGGLCVGVRDDGSMRSFACNTRYGEGFDRHFKAHPDTGTVFEQITVPQIPSMIAAAKRMHEKTPQVGMISWDLSLDEQGGIILIEANFYDQSVWFPQMINGEPLFGDDTDYMLFRIRERK